MSENVNELEDGRENEPRMSVKPLLKVAGTVIVFVFSLSAWAWCKLPADARVPVHWGISGTPDRYGGKLEAFGAAPLIVLALTGLFFLIPRIDPRRSHFAAFRRPYLLIVSASLIFLAAVHAFVVASALGTHLNMNSLCFIGVGALFVVIGNFMGKLRSNWFVGIRTPWTLSSEFTWQRTHRAGGPVLVGSGLVWIAVGLLNAGELGVYLALGVTLASALGLVVYSYCVWQRAPDRGKEEDRPA